MNQANNLAQVDVLEVWDELVSAAGEIDNGAERHDDDSGQALIYLADLMRLIGALQCVDAARAAVAELVAAMRRIDEAAEHRFADCPPGPMKRMPPELREAILAARAALRPFTGERA